MLPTSRIYVLPPLSIVVNSNVSPYRFTMLDMLQEEAANHYSAYCSKHKKGPHNRAGQNRSDNTNDLQLWHITIWCALTIRITILQEKLSEIKVASLRNHISLSVYSI